MSFSAAKWLYYDLIWSSFLFEGVTGLCVPDALCAIHCCVSPGGPQHFRDHLHRRPQPCQALPLPHGPKHGQFFHGDLGSLQSIWYHHVIQHPQPIQIQLEVSHFQGTKTISFCSSSDEFWHCCHKNTPLSDTKNMNLQIHSVFSYYLLIKHITSAIMGWLLNFDPK